MSTHLDDEAAIKAYHEAGTRRTHELDNRGPIRLDTNGRLDPAIMASYCRHGFYVFENVLALEELEELKHDINDILERAPVDADSTVDAMGRPALGVGHKGRTFTWVKPLSDPRGGTAIAHGRHPVKMDEPTPPVDAPERVVQVLMGPLQYSEACLRLYAHPELLAVAASINGEDFTPFSEALFVKQPGLGGSVAWHQDGFTHWDNPDRDEHIHGVNFMAQLYGCNAANGLWVVPGSHRDKADIRAMVESAGSDRIADAVPLICAPGDVAIVCRQVVHGSFANTSPHLRVSIVLGFQRRSSVLNVQSGGVHNPEAVYDEERIHERSRLIAYGIDARNQHFPEETRFEYRPFAGEVFRWTPEVQAGLKDYNLLDLGI